SLGRIPAPGSGIRLPQGLIPASRASMIVGVLRLTSRLLMLALGPAAFRTVLAGSWATARPQRFAAAEAEPSADHLAARDLKVPQLAKVLEFERAVTATLVDERPRVVAFEQDPVPLLRALADGRLSDRPGQLGRFEIEITPDGPVSATGLDLTAVQQAFPYH